MSIDRRTFLRNAATLGVALPTLPALVSTLGAAPAATQGDASRFVLGTWTEPATLLSGAPVTGAAYQQIQGIIANGLTRLGYPDFAVQPDLAESWEVSPDGLTYVFALRAGVIWQDGQPFSAQDVKFTYDLVSHPDWPGALDSYFANIQGAPEHKAGQAAELAGVQVVDDSHVRFTLTQVDSLFLASATSRQRVLPRHLLEGLAPADVDKSDFAREPVYTGPFAVEEWRPGESITFRAFPGYFGGAPGVDGIVARFIADPATAIAELQTGGVQIGVVNPDQFEAFAADESFATQELPGLRVLYIQFDLTLPLFADARVRQAISHAIDRETVISALYLGRGEPATNFIPPQAAISNPDLAQYPYDLARADALLTEAGWTPGEDGVRVNAAGERLAFVLTVPTANRQDGLAVQPYLAAIGVEATIEEQGAGQATGPLQVGEYQAAIGAWNNFIIDPRADLQRNFQTPRPSDPTGYRNPEVDALFLQARAALDPEQERTLYLRIQELIANDAPLVYLWRQRDLLVVNSTLSVPTVGSLSELYARLPEWQPAG